jgi:cyclohexyl-isocyanide hydratase
LYGREVAEHIQLMMEDNPAAPFTSGAPASADAALVEHAQALAPSNQEQRRQIAERAAARLRTRVPFVHPGRS